MQRPDERKTMVFITHSIDEAIVLGDRIAVMSARPGRIKEVLDMPFGRPRDVDAVRSDPRFAEIRLHIWRQLHSARPRQTQGSEGGRVTTIDQTRRDCAATLGRRVVRRSGARRARRRQRRHRRAVAQSHHPRDLARDRAHAVAGGRRAHRPDPVHDPERGRGRGGGDDPQRRAVDLSVAEPGGACSRLLACGRRSASPSGFCWRATGCSMSRSASTSPSSIRSPRSRWCR